MKKIVLMIIPVVSLLISNTSFALAPSTISNIYIFGDSLSDAGFITNDPQATPPNNTFTTPGGLVWGQQLGVDYKLPVTPNNNYSAYNQLHPNAPVAPGDYVNQTEEGNDYAAGGATTSGEGRNPSAFYSPPSLNLQVASYLAQHDGKADPAALYILWGGANNLLKLLAQLDTNPTDYSQASATAASDIVSEIKSLKGAGAKHFLVIGLPDLGDTPLVTGLGNAELTEIARLVSLNFNVGLNNALANAGLTVAFFDSAEIMNTIVDSSPTVAKPFIDSLTGKQIVNVTTPACPAGTGDALVCTPAAGTTNYMFEDDVHPTATLHFIIAKYIERTIENTNF